MNKEKGYVPPNEMPPRPIQRVLVGQKAWGTGTESGSREGGPTSQPATGAESTAAQEGREGIVILPTYTPQPQIPAPYPRPAP